MFHQVIGNPLHTAIGKLLRTPHKLAGTAIRLIARDPDAMLAAPLLDHIEALAAAGARIDLVFTGTNARSLNRRAGQLHALAAAIRDGQVQVACFRGGQALVSQLVIGDTLWIEDRFSGEPQAIDQTVATRAAHASFAMVALGARPVTSAPKRRWMVPNFMMPTRGNQLAA